MNPVLTAIMERRSIRSYEPTQISQDQLTQILDAGLWAPTARNEQEIFFAVLQDQTMLTELKQDFAASNKGAYKDFIYGAPTFILLFGDREFPFSQIDGGIAVENMALAAESLGLSSVIIGCIRLLFQSKAGETWLERLNIPKNNQFVIGIAIGTKTSDTPKRPRNADRIRMF
jgi:nitroreductase